MWSLIQSSLLLVVLALPLFLGGHFTDWEKIFDQSKEVTKSTVAPQVTTGKVVKVIDGDTIDVKQNKTNDTVRVRYIGIDTPEPYAKGPAECGSHEATIRNTELVNGQEVTMVPDKEDVDKYGRLLRYVYVDKIFINQILVQEGLARTLTIPPNTKYKYKFLKLEEIAQNDKSGMWGECFK